MNAEHASVRVLLGAHVLGGLSPEERAEVDDHLAQCPDCRAEVVAFSVVPGLLGRGPIPGPLEPEAPREGSFAALLESVRRERRRTRRTMRLRALAAVACLVVLAGFVGWAMPRGGAEPRSTAGDPTGTVVVLTADTVSGPSGSAVLDERAWGTAVRLEATSLPSVGPMHLAVTDDAGRVEQAAIWGPTPTGSAVVEGATSIATDRIVRVTVVGPAGDLLTAVTR